MLKYLFFIFVLIFIIIINININKTESFNNSNKKVHFITYGNEKFKKAKERIINEAKDSGFFTSTTAYGPEDLSSEFANKYRDILKQPRIGGYGIWRPYIILDKLNELNYNEYLIYCDAGCTINKNGERRFNEYLELINKSNYGIISFQMNQPEKKWTTAEIFNYFSISKDDDIYNSGQIIDGILIMKKTPHLLKIIKIWLQVVSDDPYLFTDKYNNNNQCSDFRDNRHEQSVFSIIRKKYGSVVINDKTYGNWKSESLLKEPFWATRKRF